MNNALTRYIAKRLKNWADGVYCDRTPDLIIEDQHGDDYLLRWYIIPRNPVFNIYLHRFHRSDDDRAMHDHPWWSASIMLSDHGCTELYSSPDRRNVVLVRDVFFGDVVFRSAKHTHSIILKCPELPTMTLFVTGPRFRVWGFWCENDRFVPWTEFLSKEHGKGGC